MERTAEDRDAHGAQRVGRDHHATPVEPVADDAAHEQENDLRRGSSRHPQIESAVGAFDSS